MIERKSKQNDIPINDAFIYNCLSVFDKLQFKYFCKICLVLTLKHMGLYLQFKQ